MAWVELGSQTGRLVRDIPNQAQWFQAYYNEDGLAVLVGYTDDTKGFAYAIVEVPNKIYKYIEDIVENINEEFIIQRFNYKGRRAIDHLQMFFYEILKLQGTENEVHWKDPRRQENEEGKANIGRDIEQ